MVHHNIIKDEMCQCQTAVISATEGEIISPNYPDKYDNDLDCLMQITVPVGHVIRFTYLLFDLESESTCDYDKFEIYDSDSSERAFSCGTTPPNFTISSTNEVILAFKTDGSVIDNGFQITFESVPV
ncbi:protein SpAN-like [Penaeus japonicus]|uniref:protein SpAN-like n=1 Tax=Penaeus japonicus TaxID=27405 RepID=UPI001C710CC4|nr:protein SpAN-like [Penaeus japonicus]